METRTRDRREDVSATRTRPETPWLSPIYCSKNLRWNSRAKAASLRKGNTVFLFPLWEIPHHFYTLILSHTLSDYHLTFSIFLFFFCSFFSFYSSRLFIFLPLSFLWLLYSWYVRDSFITRNYSFRLMHTERHFLQLHFKDT